MGSKSAWVALAIISLRLTVGAEFAASQVPKGAAVVREEQQRRIANADVIRMVREHRSESEIIREINAAIRSRTADFDPSPDALISLHKAGISTNVLNAMMGDAGMKSGVASPRSIKLGSPEIASPVKNPNTQLVGNLNSREIIAVLEKQRSGAQLEASQMVKTSSLRRAQPQTIPLQTNSASGARTGSPSGAAASATSANPTLLAPQTPQKHDPPSNPAPGSAVGSLGAMPANIKTGTAIVCTSDATMRILTVSGLDGPATFTPDPKYNFYTITGCSFGDSGPNAKAYIYYQSTFREDFQIQEWNDNGIKLALDQNIAGLLDHDNLTLVVQRNDGKQATRGGCKFYAARETRMLPYIPKTDFSLNKFTPTDTSAFQAAYTSPSSATVVPNIAGYTAEVSWTDPKVSYNKDHPNFSVWMPGGEDIYQLKNLQPGFVVESGALCHRNLECPSGAVHTEGTFGLSFVGTDMHVVWQGQACSYSGCGGFGQPDCFTSEPGSNYAVNVTITGPRGVDPWTGKPTTAH
jgi:hypothetical protein